MQADIGLIGLAVMGQNLVLNMADHGYTVAVFNRTASKTDEFLKGPAKGKKIEGSHELRDFVANLKRPRRVMLMVKAGDPVDEFIDQLVPLLEPRDIIIDGGNSHFPDTQRRYEALKARGILFIGAGISGGEEGARHGPSIMPGGNPDAWPHIKPIFQAIAAKSEDGEPCCDWVGEGGAGHYVKMVHNGIEYGDMQLICEAYDLLKKGGQKDLASIFSTWNKGALDSYLIEKRRRWPTPFRQNSRCCRSKRDWQVDWDRRAGSGNASDSHWRGRFCTLSFCFKGRESRGKPPLPSACACL
jgi:6-phosphogluconate dehydrogenase